MADTFFIEGLNTLPEQVQLNKENIKTNTDNIQRLGDLSDTYHDQIQSLNTKVSTNTANIATNTSNIATNATNIDNLSKKVYDNGTISFYLDSDKFYFKDENSKQYIYIYYPSPGTWALTASSHYFVFSNTDVHIGKLSLDSISARSQISLHGNPIRKISNSNDTNYDSLLTGKAINDTYLSKTDASTTYATKTELSNANKRIDALDTGTFDIDLTTPGLEKIKANVTIGSPITLTKDTDFSEYIDGVDTYKTILFSIYTDQSEDYYISVDIKLDVGYTADVYGDNDQYYTWLTGIGVIKLGPNTNGNNYLCYISYSQGYTSPLVITPIQKLA